jgi:SHS2 domain-containing protein
LHSKLGERLWRSFSSPLGDATINAMIDNLEAIELKETRTFRLENDELDMLLFNFLQEFVYYKDSELLMLRAQQVQIEEKNSEYHLTAVTQEKDLIAIATKSG